MPAYRNANIHINEASYLIALADPQRIDQAIRKNNN